MTFRETSSIKVDDISSQIARNVGAAVEATNSLPISSRALAFRYNRKNPKRRRLIEIVTSEISPASVFYHSDTSDALKSSVPQGREVPAEERNRQSEDDTQDECRPDHGLVSLSQMVSVLCEQHLFFPLLRAFEMFLPSCPLLPFIRSLQVHRPSVDIGSIILTWDVLHLSVYLFSMLVFCRLSLKCGCQKLQHI